MNTSIIIIFFLIVVLSVLYFLTQKDLSLEERDVELEEYGKTLPSYKYWKLKEESDEIPVIIGSPKNYYYWGVIGNGKSISCSRYTSSHPRDGVAIIATPSLIYYEKVKRKLTREWKKKNSTLLTIFQLDSSSIDFIQMIGKDNIICPFSAKYFSFRNPPSQKSTIPLEIEADYTWLKRESPYKVSYSLNDNPDVTSFVSEWMSLNTNQHLSIYALDHFSSGKALFSSIIIETKEKIVRHYVTSSSSLSDKIGYLIEPKLEPNILFRIREETYINPLEKDNSRLSPTLVFPFQLFVE